MDAGSLQARTRDLLIDAITARVTTYQKVADETRLSFYWVLNFRNGRIKNPCVDKVQKLYEHLHGQPLRVH